MKKRFSEWTWVLVFLFVALAVQFVAGSSSAPAGPATAPEDKDSLPASLDALYPPRVQGPHYGQRMLGMSFFMTGTFVDLFENDFENALANFEKFKAQYAEMSGLVPEWSHYYETAPLENMGAALKSGDQGRIMGAAEELGRVCTSCHVDNMARVQFKYHWGNFLAIQIKDPLTGQEAAWPMFKQMLETSMTGVPVDLSQGQPDRALEHARGFKARLEAFKETCQECHGSSERKYYVDEDTMKMVSDLEKTLSSPSFTQPQVESLLMGIGEEICFKCHLVHAPAGLTQFPRGGAKK